VQLLLLLLLLLLMMMLLSLLPWVEHPQINQLALALTISSGHRRHLVSRLACTGRWPERSDNPIVRGQPPRNRISRAIRVSWWTAHHR
jgi:hypothetical protein